VLLLAQAALFALAVPSVWVFARRALLRVATPRRAVVAAYLVSAAFGLSWTLQEATQAGFHEVAFFVPLSALMIERYQAGKLRQSVLCALALLFVKEDTGVRRGHLRPAAPGHPPDQRHPAGRRRPPPLPDHRRVSGRRWQ